MVPGDNPDVDIVCVCAQLSIAHSLAYSAADGMSAEPGDVSPVWNTILVAVVVCLVTLILTDSRSVKDDGADELIRVKAELKTTQNAALRAQRLASQACKKVWDEREKRKLLEARLVEVDEMQDAIRLSLSPDVDAGVADPPEHLCCPLSHDLFEDPVIAADGNTYERVYITEALNRTPGMSPLTRTPIDIDTLRDNRNIREAADRWRAANPNYFMF